MKRERLIDYASCVFGCLVVGGMFCWWLYGGP